MILLVGINAKYIHSNLGIYCIQAYARKHGIDDSDFQIKEYTINQEIDFILGDIFLEKPKMIGFSCYIWNIDIVAGISKEIHKIMPDVPIWLGGPEVSYDCDMQLKKYPWIKGIISGEGEVSFYELINHYLAETVGNIKVGLNIPGLSDIKGIVYREDAVASGVDNIVTNPPRENMSMDDIPFPYTKDAGFDIDTLKNRIIYYETSRGCPYGCSYCLSSVDKKVRFRSMALVENELQFFLDMKVPQVKFVDRTFNCHHTHAKEIWRYLLEHDNGVTNFHFEVSADLLDEEELELISRMRPGLIQLEIGVQSTNPDTIRKIRRTMNFKRLSEVTKQIKTMGNTHQHLDLIAGLPMEDYESFGKSFDDVYALGPDQLQLGFLKVLKGSYMQEHAREYGLIYKDRPPYEVLGTNWLSYGEIARLKQIEEMVEVYYNSGQFSHTLDWLVLEFDSPFSMYKALGSYYEENGLFKRNHTRIARYEILSAFIRKQVSGKEEFYRQLLVFDLYLRENVKNRPDFAGEPSADKAYLKAFYDREEKEPAYLKSYGQIESRKLRKMTHIEIFDYEVDRDMKPCRTVLLFDYQIRNPLNYEAHMMRIGEDGRDDR